MRNIDLTPRQTNVLRYIRNHNPTNRNKISQSLFIPLPSLSRLIDELKEKKIIAIEDREQSTGGRKSDLIKLNKNYCYSIGISLGREEISVALINFTGEIISHRKANVTQNDSFQTILNCLKNLYFQVVAEFKGDQKLIMGVGVALPGPITTFNDSLRTPNYFKGASIPLKNELRKFIKYQIFIEKDANAAALSEKWFGSGKSFANFTYVMADTGIGCGIILQDKLYLGDHEEAGGLGHTTIDINGELCTCGNYGCLETKASIRRIEEKIMKRSKNYWFTENKYYDNNDFDFTSIKKAYNNGSKIAEAEFQEAGYYLGIGISNFITFFDPKLIILGGKLGSLDIVIETVKKTIKVKVLGSRGRDVTVLPSSEINQVILGAGALVIEEIFFKAN